MPRLRVPGRLQWRLPAGIFALILLLALVAPVHADTGTYRILDYVATLEPQSDGQVKITYEQKWSVLSGDIPWITAGLPDSHYSIGSFSENARQVSPANSGGFTGVRVDLDKDYLPGQTFQVKFAVLQGNLLERLTSEQKWRINFTPGWYDQATTDHLQINLVSPVDYQSYSAVSPVPASVNNNIITWERTNLSPGGRFNITVESTDGSFLTAVAASTPSQGGGLSGWIIVLIVAVVILIIYGLIVLAVRHNRKSRDAAVKARVAEVEDQMARDKNKKVEVEKGFEEYVEKENIQPDAQGRYYDRQYGDYITPAIWAAIIFSQSNRQGVPPGNTGPRPGCACACVACACACACACAGGGAAGCARKTLHECRHLPVGVKAGKDVVAEEGQQDRRKADGK
jgi:hypothetical protein